MDEEKKEFTRFTVEQSDIKVTWEIPHEDISGEKCMRAIATLMLGLTFVPTTIYESMKDEADSMLEVLEPSDEYKKKEDDDNRIWAKGMKHIIEED